MFNINRRNNEHEGDFVNDRYNGYNGYYEFGNNREYDRYNNYDVGYKGKRKKHKKRRLILKLVILVLAIGFVYNLGMKTVEPLLYRGVVDIEHIYSQNAVLVKMDSGSIIEEHNSSERIYPASLTKIMTAILAIENIKDLNERITLTSDIFSRLNGTNASLAGFREGEIVTCKDLVYGVMLPSGAECSIAIANKIAGSEEAFAEMMNEKARRIGMENTNFTNATGLHDQNHYSTVEDIAKLLKYAMRSDEFRDVIKSPNYTTNPTNYNPRGCTFYSTMFKKMDTGRINCGEIIGGKTGYTDEAGLCLASVAKINGEEYILVTTNAYGTHNTAQFNIIDAINIYNQLGENSCSN